MKSQRYQMLQAGLGSYDPIQLNGVADKRANDRIGFYHIAILEHWPHYEKLTSLIRMYLEQQCLTDKKKIVEITAMLRIQIHLRQKRNVIHPTNDIFLLSFVENISKIFYFLYFLNAINFSYLTNCFLYFFLFYPQISGLL